MIEQIEPLLDTDSKRSDLDQFSSRWIPLIAAGLAGAGEYLSKRSTPFRGDWAKRS